MGRYTGKKCRLITMFVMTTSFFLVELLVGYITNSMALIADSFHMLSDVLALIIAFLSIKMSPKKWSKNTFGWARAEVLGALVNSVFLLALCFSIFVEALKRLYVVEELHNPQLIFAVGVMGLIVNIIGLGLFHEHGHGHSHGGHGHSHGSYNAKHSTINTLVATDDNENDERFQPMPPIITVVSGSDAEAIRVRNDSSSQMNMRGVFLHILSDALGSVIVIISALIVWLTNWQYSAYIDPALSLCLVLLITASTWPLLKDSAMILLQTVPTHIQVDGIQKQLKKIDGVLAVHEFHIWQLAGERIIASAHIRCRNLRDYMEIAEKIKKMFHEEGIHSTTIQPEFVEVEQEESISGSIHSAEDCILDCPTGDKGGCAANTCCGIKQLLNQHRSSLSSVADEENQSTLLKGSSSSVAILDETCAKKRGVFLIPSISSKHLNIRGKLIGRASWLLGMDLNGEPTSESCYGNQIFNSKFNLPNSVSSGLISLCIGSEAQTQDHMIVAAKCKPKMDGPSNAECSFFDDTHHDVGEDLSTFSSDIYDAHCKKGNHMSVSADANLYPWKYTEIERNLRNNVARHINISSFDWLILFTDDIVNQIVMEASLRIIYLKKTGMKAWSSISHHEFLVYLGTVLCMLFEGFDTSAGIMRYWVNSVWLERYLNDKVLRRRFQQRELAIKNGNIKTKVSYEPKHLKRMKYLLCQHEYMFDSLNLRICASKIAWNERWRFNMFFEDQGEEFGSRKFNQVECQKAYLNFLIFSGIYSPYNSDSGKIFFASSDF